MTKSQLMVTVFYVSALLPYKSCLYLFNKHSAHVSVALSAEDVKMTKTSVCLQNLQFDEGDRKTKF